MKARLGNLRYTDKELLPWEYRHLFLYFTDQLAPEVLESFKSLCPLYQAVINNYPFTGRFADWLSGLSGINLDRDEALLHIAAKDRYNVDDSSHLANVTDAAWVRATELRS